MNPDPIYVIYDVTIVQQDFKTIPVLDNLQPNILNATTQNILYVYNNKLPKFGIITLFTSMISKPINI